VAGDAEKGTAGQGGRILCLLKVGQKKHLEGLTEGRLYCRSLAYYRRLENRLDPRIDRDEGVASVLQKDRVQLAFMTPHDPRPHIVNAASGLAGPVIFRRNISSPVFCLYAIHGGGWPDPFTEKQFEEQIRPGLQPDPRMDEFGDHVWVILNARAFRDRVAAACQRRNLAAEGRLVTYVDRSIIHGHIPREEVGFTKFARFSWQREYRYMFGTSWPANKQFILNVGPLHDISAVVPLNTFRAGISFRLGSPIDETSFPAPAPSAPP
jgi:hypothetical protein